MSHHKHAPNATGYHRFENLHDWLLASPSPIVSLAIGVALLALAVLFAVLLP